MSLLRNLFSWRIANPLLSGICRSFFCLLLGAFVLSLLLWGSGLQESDLSFYTYIVHGLAALAGGWSAGKKAGSRGWYQGCLTGLLYALIILVVGFLALDNAWKLPDLLWIGAAAAAGSFGGMFGVNMQK